MTPPTRVAAIAGAVCTALFAFAFAAAPHSCEWGLAAYFWCGVAAFVALFAAPVLLRTDKPMSTLILHGAGYAGVVAAVWTAGLAVANVRILCRLF